MLRILKDYILTFLALATGTLTLWLFTTDYIGKVNDQGLIGVYFLGFFSIVFFFISLYQHVAWGRAKQYASVISILNAGYGEIHKLLRTNGSNELSLIDSMHAISHMADSLAESLSIITDSKCSVCIKILAQDNSTNGLHAKTFARSKSSSKQRSGTDNTTHWINENSDFKHIMKNIETLQGKLFLRNRLPFIFDYINTSFEYYKKPSSNIFMRWYRWPLPYRSTLVVPICTGNAGDVTEKELEGFLCVDSPKMYAFKKDFDHDMVCGVSDALYGVLKRVPH